MKRWMDKIRFMAVIMVSVFIPASNEPSGRACADSWRMPRGSIPMCPKDTFLLGRFKFHALLLAAGLLTAACFGAGTVIGRAETDAQEPEGYYHSLERDLVEDAREFLNGEGYADSGVMLTRVIEADGSRQYTLTVHHRKIDKLEESDRQYLAEELEKIAFEDANSTFFINFL